MNEETKQSNLELQSDEIQVLQSIYGESLTYIDSELCYRIEVNIHDDLSPLTFQFWYPESYPSHDAPQYTIRCPWITKQSQNNEFAQMLHEMFEPGNVVVYQWIEWLKNGAFYDLNLEYLLNTDGGDHDNDGVGDDNGDAHDRDDYSSVELVRQDYHHHGTADDGGEYSEAVKRLNIKHGLQITEKKSVFVAHVATVRSLEDVHLFLSELKRDRKVASATHNIVAYRFTKQSKVTGEELIEENRDDDGETGASSPMLFLLQRSKVVNVCVVVTRWFGGVLMGPDRFRVITNVAKELLQQEGYLKTSSKK